MTAHRALLCLTLAVVAGWGLTACTGGGPSPETTSASSASAVDTLLETGIAQAGAGDLDAAVATFENVLVIDPDSALAHYNLGVIAQQRGDTASALTSYDAALALAPQFTSAMYNKAIILEATDVPAAIELYRAVIAIDAQAATSYLRLSLLLEAQGDASGAAEAQASALAIDPTLASAIPTPTPTPVPDATPDPEE